MLERTEVVVVGGGQAGIAMSEHLGAAGIAHVVLERRRVAERWRSERWDSLVANGPAWHDRFPGMTYPTCAPDGFPGKDEIAAYFEQYAARVQAPIRCGVDVTEVARNVGGRGFRVATSAGEIEADAVVAATGAFQTPVVPPLVPVDAPVVQLHSNAYRNPVQLPDGAVMVIGAGSSGVQIADELARAGRRVYLSVGRHARPPRRYRGRDFVWWLGVLNLWDAEADAGSTHTTIAVSGAQGGHTVDFRRLAGQGITLVGSTVSYEAASLTFADDLRANIAAGDADYLGLLDAADAYVRANDLDLPPEPSAREFGAEPACVTEPLRTLDLAAAGVTSIVWATGYTADYRWLPGAARDDTGRPVHRRGVSAEPGVYFLGLPWQTRRGSSFIWGVWYDAKYVADHIAKQRSYAAYRPGAADLAAAPAAVPEPAPAPSASDEGVTMAHTRIRLFNTRDTYPEQNLDNDLSQAVVARGATIFLRGQCPQDLDTSVDIASGDPVEQTHKVMQNIRQLIEEAGGTMQHLCKVVVYLTDVRHREAVYRTMGEYLHGVHPVSTGLVVTALARPNWLVEIDATAVIPD